VSKSHKRPPDPDGTFKRAAARAKKVITFYEELYPDPGRAWLVANLLHDLLHLCDRDRTLGSFTKSHGDALWIYEDLAAENMWVMDWYDDLVQAHEAAREMLERT
jgi:hypothetical protein